MMSEEEDKTLVKADVHFPSDEIEELEDDAEPDEQTGRREIRTRKMTEKGKEFALEKKRARLELLCKQLEKGIDQLLRLIDDEDMDLKNIQGLYKKWANSYDEFLAIDQDYRQLLAAEEEKTYQDSWFSARNRAFIEFKNTAIDWFNEQSKETQA